MKVTFTVNGREIHNPTIRLLIAALAIAAVLMLIVFYGLLVLPVLLLLIAASLILTLPLHFALRLFGRRGFYVEEDNRISWTSTGAFQRRK